MGIGSSVWTKQKADQPGAAALLKDGRHKADNARTAIEPTRGSR